MTPLIYFLDGEIYLEQKYPLTRDPVGGEQFPIVDDGYLWSSIPKPEIREYQGQVLTNQSSTNYLFIHFCSKLKYFDG